MGNIQLTRIDDRLLHGQVMTRWAKGNHIDAIFIIDDQVANDDFMKQLYLASGQNAGFKVNVLTVENAVGYWREKQFDQHNVLILFKSVDMMAKAVREGLPIKTVNVGGIGKRKETKFVINTVAISLAELETLESIANQFNVEISFQTLPDSPKVGLADVRATY
ncbi:MAG: PTS system mannose/fructose/N-acetylgalactosamine-transporter subunit IIB [Erysipelotrichaceae bacterium]